jgi:hypothetical protein
MKARISRSFAGPVQEEKNGTDGTGKQEIKKSKKV